MSNSPEGSVSVIDNSKQVERYNFRFFRSLNLFIGSARLSTTDLWRKSSKYILWVVDHENTQVAEYKIASNLCGVQVLL